MIDFSAKIKPYSSMDECGDFYVCEECDDSFLLAIGDIGGHGSPNVFRIANEIKHLILNNISLELFELMSIIHNQQNLKYNGMVLFLGRIYKNIPIMKYCEIGNIKAKLIRDYKITDLLSQDGIIGYSIPPNIKTNMIKLSKDDVVIIATDGIGLNNITIKKYLDIKTSASNIANICIDNFAKHNDDSICAVIKYKIKLAYNPQNTQNIYTPSKEDYSSRKISSTPQITLKKTAKIIEHHFEAAPHTQIFKTKDIQLLSNNYLLASMDESIKSANNIKKIFSISNLDKSTITKTITFVQEVLSHNFGLVKIYFNFYKIQIAAPIHINFIEKLEFLFSDYSTIKIDEKYLLAIIEIKLPHKVNITQEEIEELKEQISLGVDSRSLQQMKQSQHKEKLLFEQSKLASMGEMIGNIAHQWRQPLSVISTLSTGLKMQIEFGMFNNKEAIEGLDNINKATQFLSKTIDDFRNFIKSENVKEQYTIMDVLNQTLSLVDASIKNHQIELVTKFYGNARLEGFPNELIQALINIINNAKDALQNIDEESEKIIIIETSISETLFSVSIKDNGGGIDKNIIDRIFEPYFTTKHKSQGTGIGLHMTRQIIVEHNGGNIYATNTNLEYNGKTYAGAQFTIDLPILEIL